MSLSGEEIQKAKEYDINIENSTVKDVQYQIKKYEFKQTKEYKKYLQVADILLEKDNVTGVAFSSKICEPIVLTVFLKEEDPNFPTEIEGIILKLHILNQS